MSPMYKVLVADQIALDGLAPLRDDARFELIVKPGLKGAELADAIAAVDAVLVRSATQITRESLAKANGLKVIGRAGVGVDTIDVDAATERGIAVLTAPAGNTISAAELTLALTLALLRRVPAADRSMKAGQWDRKSFSGTELYGKTLGLVGAGRIGGEVAKRARAFGMHVVAYDPFLIAERAQSLGIERVELDDRVPSRHPHSSISRPHFWRGQREFYHPGRGRNFSERVLPDPLDGHGLGGRAVHRLRRSAAQCGHAGSAHRSNRFATHIGWATGCHPVHSA